MWIYSVRLLFGPFGSLFHDVLLTAIAIRHHLAPFIWSRRCCWPAAPPHPPRCLHHPTPATLLLRIRAPFMTDAPVWNAARNATLGVACNVDVDKLDGYYTIHYAAATVVNVYGGLGDAGMTRQNARRVWIPAYVRGYRGRVYAWWAARGTRVAGHLWTRTAAHTPTSVLTVQCPPGAGCWRAFAHAARLRRHILPLLRGGFVAADIFCPHYLTVVYNRSVDLLDNSILRSELHPIPRHPWTRYTPRWLPFPMPCATLVEHLPAPRTAFPMPTPRSSPTATPALPQRRRCY